MPDSSAALVLWLGRDSLTGLGITHHLDSSHSYLSSKADLSDLQGTNDS